MELFNPVDLTVFHEGNSSSDTFHGNPVYVAQV